MTGAAASASLSPEVAAGRARLQAFEERWHRDPIFRARETLRAEQFARRHSQRFGWVARTMRRAAARARRMLTAITRGTARPRARTPRRRTRRPARSASTGADNGSGSPPPATPHPAGLHEAAPSAARLAAHRHGSRRPAGARPTPTEEE